MTLALIFALVILLTGCGGGSDGASQAQPPEPVSVDIFADSIARSPGLPVSLVQSLQAARPGWTVQDHSATGLDLDALVVGYREPWPGAPADAFPLGPQPRFADVRRQGRVVVLGLGVNDALEMRTPKRFEADLRQVIQVIQAEGRLPVLTGLVDLPVADLFTLERIERRRQLDAVTRAVAAELGLQHAGWGQDYRGPTDVRDNVHRTQEASDRLALLLVAAIERACP
ncbi:GDSL-type esterase/lipase family protein [Acidovorax sp. NCPPB 4044]|uniref:GDSL-type esterase/lipase family protein n=1 Tax=Acidovorax sp. NCPPB 4044 TaxID=2940490 RepID=UPI0023026F8F|nr:GDSL-type esterase/lipase family protein [Acidovorax sp. NCPPB 4044]MDA8522300.1 GDSL-type esterase/lipase family protein [Acidovorax sp. NCPPB 4044]